MKNIILIFLFTAVSITACNTSQDHSHNNSEAIQLNEGAKWLIVPEMMAYIQQIETDVNSFNGVALSEHKKLGESIDSNLTKLTSNCTMTGQAHDELHKWLLPFLDLADFYKKVGTKEEAETFLTEIKSSFETFNTYFK